MRFMIITAKAVIVTTVKEGFHPSSQTKKGGPQPFHRRDLHQPPPQGKTVALKG